MYIVENSEDRYSFNEGENKNANYENFIHVIPYWNHKQNLMVL